MTNDEMRARCEREIAAIERKLRGIDPMEPDDKLDGMLRGYLDWHLELKELNRDRSIAHDYIRDNFRGEDTIAVVLLNKQTGNIQQRVAKAAKIATFLCPRLPLNCSAHIGAPIAIRCGYFRPDRLRAKRFQPSLCR